MHYSDYTKAAGGLGVCHGGFLMSYMDHAAFAGGGIQDMSLDEIELVDGAGRLAGAAAGAGALAAVAGWAATIPSPGAPAFGFVALSMGLLAAGLGWADSSYGDSGISHK